MCGTRPRSVGGGNEEQGAGFCLGPDGVEWNQASPHVCPLCLWYGRSVGTERARLHSQIEEEEEEEDDSLTNRKKKNLQSLESRQKQKN